MIRAFSGRNNNPSPLHHFQTCHCAGTGGEAILFETVSVENAQEEIRQWVVIFRVESQVLAMLESAAGEKHGHVPVVVGTAVAEIGCHEHASSIEHSAIGLFCPLQVGAGNLPSGERVRILRG